MLYETHSKPTADRSQESYFVEIGFIDIFLKHSDLTKYLQGNGEIINCNLIYKLR